MANSFEFVHEKDYAIKKLREMLNTTGHNVKSEQVINNGCGQKFICSNFAVVLYFKAEKSSKVVLENAPEDVYHLFQVIPIKINSENTDETEIPSPIKTIPVYSSLKIETTTKQGQIKCAIKAKFSEIEETKPKDYYFQ